MIPSTAPAVKGPLGGYHMCDIRPTKSVVAAAIAFGTEVQDAMENNGFHKTGSGDNPINRVVKPLGYVPVSRPSTLNLTGHWVHPGYLFDGRVNDPNRIEALWYGFGDELLAGMFLTQQVYEEYLTPAGMPNSPSPGGCMTPYHTHPQTQATFLRPPDISEGAEPGNDCWKDMETFAMLHVFTREDVAKNNYTNPFGDNMGSHDNVDPADPNHAYFCKKNRADHPLSDFGSRIVWEWTRDVWEKK
jgi:hypothetical protein